MVIEIPACGITTTSISEDGVIILHYHNINIGRWTIIVYVIIGLMIFLYTNKKKHWIKKILASRSSTKEKDAQYEKEIKQRNAKAQELGAKNSYKEALDLMSENQKILKNVKHPELKKRLHKAITENLDTLRISKIRMSILNLGTKFARLQVKEIAEKTGEKFDLIIDTVKKMVANEDIYAEYFASSQAVAFDQQANIDEIDELMNQYKDWESKGEGKKS